jgi:hypothetical protein
VPDYVSWRQIAGYFDGDGTIAISDTSNQPYKLGLSLVFVDQSVDQIRNVQVFLVGHGVVTSNILKRSKGMALALAVSQSDAVRRALRCMLPYLCKKEIEARAAIEYLDGKITGNELAAVFSREVEAGRRERRDHKVVISVPYTRPDGHRIMQGRRRIKLRDAFGRYRAKVTPEDYENIRTKHFEQGRRLRDLTKEYPQYARETIRRVLGGGRGSVGVKGLGHVDTTDNT